MAVADWIRIAILSLVWGGSFFFVEVMLEAMPPMTSVLGRLLIGLVGLVCLLKVLGYSLKPVIEQWRPFAFIGLINNAIPFSLISFGQTEITGSLASIINASTPIMTALVAHHFTLDERLSVSKVLAFALDFLAFWCCLGQRFCRGASLLGMTAGLTATICYAFGSVYSKRLKSNPPMLNATGQVFYGTLWIFQRRCFLTSRGRFLRLSWNLVGNAGNWFLSTTLAFFLYFRILQTAGASNVVLVTFLVPISASGLGMAFLGEELHTTHHCLFVDRLWPCSY